MAQLAQDEFRPPPEVDTVRYSFYRRAAPMSHESEPSVSNGPDAAQQGSAESAAGSSSSNRQAQHPMAMSVDLDDLRLNTSFSTPTRPQRTIQRNASAGAALGGAEAQASSAIPGNGALSNATEQQGMVTIELKNISTCGKSLVDIVADAIETHNVPPEHHFELFQRVRSILALHDKQSRHQLLTCRLLALASYAHIVSEHTANTQIFLFEPQIIRSIATLVDLQNEASMQIRASAFYALDGFVKFRGKATEVYNSVSASANHGILLQNVRAVADEITRLPEDLTPQANGERIAPSNEPSGDLGLLVDAVLTFVAAVAGSSGSTMMVASAGLMPLLVHIVDHCKSRRYLVQRTVSRAIGLIDSLVYAHIPAFTTFCDAHGLDVYVTRIEQEIDFNIEHPEPESGIVVSPQIAGVENDTRDNLYGKLTFGGASLLRNLFKSIAHMMTSTGTADGLRNLIDTSLLASLRKIMDLREIFGPQILALCINIMANFVHNEPTSLTTIQEKKLPDRFFEMVEQDIEANFEVIASIPNAISAICLNQAGLDLFNSKQIVQKLIKLLVSDRHVKILQDRENASMFGTAIDELVRHQPSVKDSVIRALLEALEDINARGAEWTAEKDDAKKAIALKPAGEPEPTPQIYELVTVNSPEEQPFSLEEHVRSSVTLSDLIVDESDTMSKKDDPATVNAVVASMDTMARFLEGFFQTQSHCRDFIRADGLPLLLKFYESPAIPYNFSGSFTADSLVALIRAMTEMSANSILTALGMEVRKSLEATASIWKQSTAASGFLPLLTAKTPEELKINNQAFRQLVILNARLNLLSDMCQHFSYAGARMPAAFLQSLNEGGSDGSSLLEELGRLLQDSMWENLMLKASTPSPGPVSQKATHSRSSRITGLTEDIVEDVPGESGAKKADKGEGKPAGEQPDEQESKESKLPEGVRQNALVLRYVASQIPACLNFLFHEVVRLLFPRRTVDTLQKGHAFTAAKSVAKTLSESLVWRDSKNSSNDFAFATLMIDFADGLIYDNSGRASSGVHVAVLSAFEQDQGVERLLDIFRRYTEEIDLHFVGQRKIAESEEDAIRLGHACGGLRCCLHLLQNIASAKNLCDSPQLAILDSIATESEIFRPHAFNVRVRAQILNAVKTIWDKDWLFSLPLLINRWLVKIVLVILRGEHEEEDELLPAAKPPANAAASRLPNIAGLPTNLSAALAGLSGSRTPLTGALGPFGTARQPPVPDESRVAQLVEMGFPAASARRALQRTNNSSTAALEYLLTVSTNYPL